MKNYPPDMLLLRLSGHSGAGKTRLVNALPLYGINCPKVLRYTSRPARMDEIHGQDYYFMSRSFIESLPEKDFLVGPVRNMMQAFDLSQIEIALKTHKLLLIEIYPDLWPRLLERIKQRLGNQLHTASVFMTAVDPEHILALPDDESRSAYICQEVERIVTFRKKDAEGDIRIRALWAAREILEAIGPEGRKTYAKIIHSAPEGPDGEDDWTRAGGPYGNAKKAIQEFVEFYLKLTSPEV